MRLPKLVHKAPQEIAKAIVEKLEQSLDNVDKIEIAGPGFINFRMKKTAISSVINTVLEKGAKYGQNYSGKRESVLVEYVSANPTGNLHLGHARGAVWGLPLIHISMCIRDSIQRIGKAAHRGHGTAAQVGGYNAAVRGNHRDDDRRQRHHQQDDEQDGKRR